MTYVMTDDPNDPCSYCVQWMTEDGKDWPEQWEDAVPWASPTQRADRIYQAVHDECEKAAMQYVAESREW